MCGMQNAVLHKRDITYHCFSYASRRPISDFTSDALGRALYQLGHAILPRNIIFIGGTAPNQVIARSEFEVHREIYKE